VDGRGLGCDMESGMYQDIFATEFVDMFPRTNGDMLLHSILVWIGSRLPTSIRTYRATLRLCAFWADEKPDDKVRISIDMDYPWCFQQWTVSWEWKWVQRRCCRHSGVAERTVRLYYCWYLSVTWIAHHLWVVFGFHQNAEPVFEVNDVQNLVCNDQAVAGAESIRNPSGKVQALFHKNLRIRTEFFCFLQLFHDIGAVLVRAVFHFLIKPDKGFCRVSGCLSKCCQDFVFA